MTADVEGLVRRQWRWYAAVLNGLFVGFTYFVVNRNAVKPHTWLTSNARFTAVSWLLPVLYLGTRYRTLEVSLPVAPPFLIRTAVSVAALIMAGRAKGRVMPEIGLGELLGGDLGTRFTARDNNGVLEVDNVRVMMSCTVTLWRTFDHRTETWHVRTRNIRTGRNRMHIACSLADIESMRTITIPRPRTYPVPGFETRLLKLSPGPALRFEGPDGEWIFSTNRAQDAFDVIKNKRTRLGPPGLGNFLPGGL